MQDHTAAIVLSAIKYAESDLIVSLLTRELGLKSYLLKGVRKSRKSKIKAAYFQPLTLLNIVGSHKPNRSLDYLKEVSVSHPLATLHLDIVKSSLSLFLAQCFKQSLVDAQPDPDLYDYLENSIRLIDQSESVANLHLKILLDFTKHLGIYPDDTMAGVYFNPTEAVFSDSEPFHNLVTKNNSNFIRMVLGTKFDAIQHVKMDRDTRTSILDLIMAYYEIHLHSFKKPSSVAILKTLFD